MFFCCYRRFQIFVFLLASFPKELETCFYQLPFVGKIWSLASFLNAWLLCFDGSSLVGVCGWPARMHGGEFVLCCHEFCLRFWHFGKLCWSASSACAPLHRGKMQSADEGTKIFSYLVADMSTLHTKSLDCCTSSFLSGWWEAVHKGSRTGTGVHAETPMKQFLECVASPPHSLPSYSREMGIWEWPYSQSF
jgi:hypothetical protein